MNDFINHLAFGWYPYLAVTVLVVGSISASMRTSSAGVPNRASFCASAR